MNLPPFVYFISLAAVLLAALIILGALGRIRSKRRSMPIGQMIDIGGYRLHLYREGTGSPAVVLEAGAGGIGLSWELVRPAIAKVAQVVVYDRAGLGWSDASPRPRTAEVMAEELHTLLHNAGIEAPYLLVGHSLGGPSTRQFALRYPEEVTGLVMVDSAYEQQMAYFPQPLVKMVNSMKAMFTIMTWLSRLGIFALKPDLIELGDNGKLPQEIVGKIRTVLASSDTHTEALRAETENANRLNTPPVATLGALPMTVISHGKLDENAVPPALGQAVRDDYEKAWQHLQEVIAALSTRSKHIVAENSGHNIQFDQPEIIIAAILEMINTVQNPIEQTQPMVGSGEWTAQKNFSAP